MSKKDYKKGMADAMEAYRGFGEKQEAAIRHVGREVEKTAQKVDKLGGKIGEITDYITDQEKAELYKLNTPVDIADLEDAEKRILVAVLYQLSADADEVTEEQQNYLRAVQQYLKIYNPQTEIDLEAVENIEDISAQKAVLQAVLEFFRLGTEPDELTEEQEDFLDCFQVNRRTRREIDGYINAIVEAVGVKGLSEKYGFVAAQPKSGFAKYQDNGRIPERVADLCIAQFQVKDENDYNDDDDEYGESGIRSFEDGQYFLETKDFIVFLKVRATVAVFDEDEDYDLSDDKESGLFRVSKQSGKLERIRLDYKKIARFWAKWYYLGYCIVKDTIYFTNRRPERNEKVTVLAVNAREETSQVLSIPYTVCKATRIHISANESYLMAAVLETDGGYLSMEPAKTYVVDLTQGNRTFVLKPALAEIYDAFLWDGKFLFWGTEKPKGPYSPTSIFQYDLERRAIQEMRTGADNLTFSILGNSTCFMPEKLTTIEHMWCFNDTYYFWSRSRESDHRDDALIGILPDGYLYTWQHECHLHLSKFNFATGKKSYPCDGDKTPDAYILLGDYLYRRYYDGWQKANISGGLDSLQWEIIQFQD